MIDKETILKDANIDVLIGDAETSMWNIKR